MTSPVVDKELFQRLLQADEIGIRMEVVGGLPMWEASPALIHQEALDRIRASIRTQGETSENGPECNGYHIADV